MKKITAFVVALMMVGVFVTPAVAQVLTTGNITANSSGSGCTVVPEACVAVAPSSAPSITFQVSGTFTGTLTPEATSDGANWVGISTTNIANSTAATTIAAAGQYAFTNPGVVSVRLRATAWTSGTAVVAVTRGWGSGGGTGGGGGVVNVADPNTPSQKAAVNASGQLSITCANCSGSGASAVDEAAFTAGAGSGAPAMGLFETAPTTVTTGKAAVLGMTNDRNLKVDFEKVAGTAADVNTGNASAGTLRVVLATNQPNLTSALNVGAAQTGNWTIRNVGNAGAVLDFAGQNAASPANSFLMGAQFNTTPTTLTTGNASPLQMDSAGNLLVNVKAGGGAGGTSSSFGSAFPATGTAVGAKDSTGTNMAALNLDASGFLKVNVAAGAAGGVSQQDNTAFTYGTTTFAPVGGVYNSTITSLTSGDAGAVALTIKRAAQTSLFDPTGAQLLPNAAALADATANPTTTGVANFNMCYNGTTWDRCKSSSTNTGTLDATTQRVTLATNDPIVGSIASPSAEVLSTVLASGSVKSGAIASGAVASGAVASGAYASGSISDGADVTLGAKADAKSTATDTTAITVMQVLKEISAMEQAPASRAVTNAGTFTVQPAAATTGGATPGNYISAASNNSTNIKASAGQVYYLTVINTTATLKYIRLYDSASAPTCTSATGVVFYSPIPANSTTGAGFVLSIPPGAAFASGIGFCITGGAGTTDNTSTAAGDVVLNYGIK